MFERFEFSFLIASFRSTKSNIFVELISREEITEWQHRIFAFEAYLQIYFHFVTGYMHMNGDVGEISAGHHMYSTTPDHYNMSVVGGVSAGEYG